EVKTAVQRIAATLDESKIQLIQRIILLRGLDYAQSLLDQTLEIEAQGGMLIKEGDRRRTPGGVFFALAKQTLTEDERQRVFPQANTAQRRRVGVLQAPVFSWEDWTESVEKTRTKKGKASEVILQI